MDAPEVMPSVIAGARVVVFDLDGTLYDDGTYLAAADRAIGHRISAEYGLPEAQVVQAIAGALRIGGRRGYLTRLQQALGLPSESVRMMLGVMRSVRAQLQLFPWVVPLLKRLHAAGVDIFVLTNGNLDQQRNKAGLLGLERLRVPVRVVYAAESKAKPEPEALRAIVSAAGVRRDQALMVGNDEVDKACALACGVPYLPVETLVMSLEPRLLDRT